MEGISKLNTRAMYRILEARLLAMLWLRIQLGEITLAKWPEERSLFDCNGQIEYAQLTQQ